MEVLYRSCCGIDIHTKTAVVCLLKDGAKETRTYRAMTADLLEMLDWLESEDCTHVAIESTGVYWRPVLISSSGTTARRGAVRCGKFDNSVTLESDRSSSLGTDRSRA